jgi:alpha-pyrone synthase
LSLITAIETIDPPYRYSQDEIREFMLDRTEWEDPEDRKWLKALYRHSGIGERYSVLPDFSDRYEGVGLFDKKGERASVERRMERFREEAPELASQLLERFTDPSANPEAFRPGPQELDSFTHLITVSCTGLSAPGLDIETVRQTGLPKNIERHSVQFMGCYAVFQALRIADHICRADPDSKVLLLSVELCTLHFDPAPESDRMMANALFGDGAAACIVEGDGPGKKGLRTERFSSGLLMEGKEDMGWELSEAGFLMRLSKRIPELVEGEASGLFTRLLGEEMKRSEIDHWCIHPGGRKVLDGVARAEGLTNGDMRQSYEVLKERGNLSSATILHILQKVWQEAANEEKLLASGFGPGLSLEAALMEVRC